MTTSPSDHCFSLINAGTSCFVPYLGDSTVYAAGDSVRGTMGRIGQQFGTYLNCNAEYGVWGSGSYDTKRYPLHSGSSSKGKLTMLNGAWPGMGNEWIIGNLPALSANSLGPVGMVMIGIGINDKSKTSDWIVSEMETMVNLLLSEVPGTPIVITTQNTINDDQYLSVPVHFDALVQHFLGVARPMNPVMAKTLQYPDVWVMDTAQFTYPWSPTNAIEPAGSSLHLSSAGYDAQAGVVSGPSGMVPTFIAGVSNEPPTIITTAINTITTGKPFAPQQLDVSGTPPITWSATGLPTNMSLSPAGVLSGTTPDIGTYSFTVTASNSFSPAATHTFSGPISTIAAFDPNSLVRWKVKLGGDWYPVNMKVKASGAWKSAIFRC